MRKLILNIDYYFENGKTIFSRKFLLERGFCCNSTCINCPYKKDKEKEKEDIK